MKKKTKARLMITAIIATIILSILGPFVATSQDSHHFNVRYRLWKLGMEEWDPSFGRWLLVDRGLSADLSGKTRQEVEKLIPDLHDTPRNRNQEMGSDFNEVDDSAQYLWIGDSNLLARFDDSKFTTFWVIKP
jgi:hypothetical protein